MADEFVGVRHRGGAHHPGRVRDRQHPLAEQPRGDGPLDGLRQHDTIGVVDQQPGPEHRQGRVMERHLVSFDPQRPLPIEILRRAPGGLPIRDVVADLAQHRPHQQRRRNRRPAPTRHVTRGEALIGNDLVTMRGQPRVERVVVTLEQPGQQRIHPEEAPLAVSRPQHHDLAAIPSHEHDQTEPESRAPSVHNPPTFSAAT